MLAVYVPWVSIVHMLCGRCTFINIVNSVGHSNVDWLKIFRGSVVSYDYVGLEHCKFTLPVFHEYLLQKEDKS